MRNTYQKILLAAATVMMAVPALAEEAAATATKTTDLAHVFTAAGGWMALAVGLCIGLAAFGGALGQGRAASAALDGIARNPAASGKLFLPMIISLALIESLVIYALVISFQMNGALTKAIEAISAGH